MSCNVLDIELEDKIVIKELGEFFMANFKDTRFVLQKKNQPTKQASWCTRNLHGIVWNSGRWDYSELSSILPRAVKGQNFPK